MSKKIAYIIHPFRDDKENNEKNMKFIAAVAVRSGTVPIATALYFPHFLNEENEAERLEGIDCGLTLMECCDEVWLFGFNISEGMKMELDCARELKLPVRLYDMHMNRINLRTLKDYGRIYLRREDVLHIPGLGFDGLVGYSPIAMAKNAVGMTLACEEYGASFFANGATPGGVLEHPGVLKDPAKVRDSWHKVYGGSRNAGKVAVLEEGMKYQQIGIPPEEAQFLETRKFQINEIARMYRIPPHMVGDLEKSSFSNIEQQSLEFVKYTLDPWVVRWEQALQKALLLPQEKNEYFIKLNVDGLLRGDYASRMNGYAVGRQNGWLSANDIREMEDQNPIPEEDGGDLYLVNGSMTKLADAGAFAGKAGGNMPQV